MLADDGAMQAELDYCDWMARGKAEMDSKAKPVGSLGVLEALACRLAALQRTLSPRVGRACLLVFGADHGIAAARPEISAFPRAVSAPVFRAVVRGQAASAVLCAANGCSTLLAVDVGLAADVTDAHPPPRTAATPAAADASGRGSAAEPEWRTQIAVMHRKVRVGGSGNMLVGPAMTEDELAAALQTGADAVQVAVRGIDTAAAVPGGVGQDAGCGGSGEEGAGGAGGDGPLPDDWRSSVICLGEVGIGNTTAAAALLAALTGASPEDVCGRGTGVSDDGLEAKRSAVAETLKVNSELLAGGGALGALRAVGGLELAAMAGAALEAARLGLPVVVDGFISGAAALAAFAHDPRRVGRVLVLSHRSSEHGAALLLSALLGTIPLLPHVLGGCGDQEGGGGAEGQGGVRGAAAAPADGARPTPAVLDMGLRLGEGTGALMVLPLLRSAAALMRRMATLEQVLAA